MDDFSVCPTCCPFRFFLRISSEPVITTTHVSPISLPSFLSLLPIPPSPLPLHQDRENLSPPQPFLSIGIPPWLNDEVYGSRRTNTSRIPRDPISPADCFIGMSFDRQQFDGERHLGRLLLRGYGKPQCQCSVYGCICRSFLEFRLLRTGLSGFFY